MKILITGAGGFLARNVKERFEREGHLVVSVSHLDEEGLFQETRDCQFVFHLAAVQRSENEQEFYDGNIGYTKQLIGCLEAHENACPVLFTTSTAIRRPSVFSKTKIEAERLLRMHVDRTGSSLYVYMLNHIYGRYGKPYFNNVIATFCYNVSHGIPIVVDDPSAELNLTYVDDLLIDFMACVDGRRHVNGDGHLVPSIIVRKTIGELVELLGRIKRGDPCRDFFEVNMNDTYAYFNNLRDTF